MGTFDQYADTEIVRGRMLVVNHRDVWEYRIGDRRAWRLLEVGNAAGRDGRAVARRLSRNKQAVSLIPRRSSLHDLSHCPQWFLYDDGLAMMRGTYGFAEVVVTLLGSTDAESDVQTPERSQSPSVLRTPMQIAPPPVPWSVTQDRALDGERVTDIVFRGRRCWLLAEVERFFGYEVKSLGRLLRGDWSSEASAGIHFDVVRGDELKMLKSLLNSAGPLGESETPSGPADQAPALTLVYQAGIDLIYLKTEKPAGRRAREFLVTNTFPMLRGETPAAVVPVTTGRSAEELAFERERLAADVAKSRSSLLRDVMDSLDTRGVLSPVARSAWMGKIAELGGVPREMIVALLPAETQRWSTPTQIAGRMKCTTAWVGHAITDLGIRAHVDGEVESYTTLAEGQSRVVECWRYGVAATARIEEWIRSHPRPVRAVDPNPRT